MCIHVHMCVCVHVCGCQTPHACRKQGSSNFKSASVSPAAPKSTFPSRTCALKGFPTATSTPTPRGRGLSVTTLWHEEVSLRGPCSEHALKIRCCFEPFHLLLQRKTGIVPWQGLKHMGAKGGGCRGLGGGGTSCSRLSLSRGEQFEAIWAGVGSICVDTPLTVLPRPTLPFPAWVCCLPRQQALASTPPGCLSWGE